MTPPPDRPIEQPAPSATPATPAPMDAHSGAAPWRAVLCGVNSRHSQTNPAIRSIAAYAENRLPWLAQSAALLLREYQTGQPVEAIARDLLDCAADLYAFSCYIWNRRAIFDIIACLRRMRPQALIVIGGPEVSFSAAAILDATPDINGVISGEGEAAFTGLLNALAGPIIDRDAALAGPIIDRDAALAGPIIDRDAALAAIPGLAWRAGTGIHVQPPANAPLDMASLPFPYPDDLPELADRLLYYESSRGCPFRCSYCLSSIERRLRFRPIEQTLVHLDRFIAADVRIVKFVDRTFNCDPRRARAIWAHLIKRHREQAFRTTFHFELAGDLLETADLDLLAEAPPGLFQFEIGVQSIRPDTLDRIRRTCDLPRLFANVRSLRAGGRQHLHLDLIAGLPGETLADVTASFNALYRLGADQLQLGFLKLLPGTPILAEAARCGYRAEPFPPYEVLASDTLPAWAFSRLHDIEAALESFANGGHFRTVLTWLVPRFDTPYAFFETLAEWIARAGLKHQSLSIDQRAVLLLELAGERLSPAERTIVAGLLRFDHYRSGRKDAPEHLGALESRATPRQRTVIAQLRRSRLPGVRIRVEAYPFSVSRLMAGAVDVVNTGGAPEWAVYDLSGPAPVLIESLPAVSADEACDEARDEVCDEA